MLLNHPVLQIDTDINLSPECSYADLNNIPNLVNNDLFSILMLNIRSCRKNFDCFMSYFFNYVSKYSIIVLTETWLIKNFSNLFTICGFKHVDSFRANNGGGLRVYIRDNIEFQLLPLYTIMDDYFEMLTIEIVCPDNNIVVSVLYHPPSSDHNINRYFIDQYCSKLADLRERRLPTILCGDFNLNLFNPLKLRYISEFMDSMQEIGMSPVITIPTKINLENRVTRYSLIDQIWSNVPFKVRNAFVTPLQIADHFPVSAGFEVLNFTKTKNFIKRTFNHDNNMAFTNLASNITPDDTYDNMNLIYSTYFSSVFAAYERAYPLSSRSIKPGKNSPWITTSIRKCIQKKAVLYRMVLRGTIHKESYNIYRNRLTSLLRRAKRLYYFKSYKEVSKNSSKLWSHINQTLGNGSRVSLESLKVDNQTLTGNDMVNFVNNYFVEVAVNLTENLEDRPLTIFCDPSLISFHFFPTDVEEVTLTIRSLKNKGNGLRDLSIISLKNNAHIFSNHLSFLYNLSIDKETYPDLMKNACVTPVHKSGSKENIDNYRPISNLPLFSKVFEKLTLKRLRSFIKKYRILNDSQYGFRPGRSISQAATRLTSLITEAFHRKSYSCCFFLDLRKAFDTVDHEILIRKLHHYGFRSKIKNYLTSYLRNRTQFVQCGGLKSNKREINKGVPQGSLLGPLLFILYINDIVSAVNAEVVLFADDAAFFLSASSPDELYMKIRKLFLDLSSYLKINKLIPNLTKSKLMMFSSRTCNELPDLSFDGVNIEWVAEYKYLGLILTTNMSFGPHINSICTKVSQYSGIFYQLNKTLPRQVMVLLYNSFVLPHLIMHIEMWGAAPHYHLNKIIIKQNQLLRSILGIRMVNGMPTMHTIEMYKSLKFLTIPNLFKLHIFKFLIMMLNGCLPFFYDKLLRPYEAGHHYSTRTNAFRLPYIMNEVQRRSVGYQVISLERSMNTQEFTDVSLKVAINKFKTILVDSQ